MTTRSELLEGIRSSLHSYTGVHERVTSLASSMTDVATTAELTEVEGAKRGIVEIDDEMLYATSVSGQTLQLPPFGRGYRGSTAAAHDAGAMVTFDPAFPRFEIGRVVDEVVAGLFPALYQVKETTFEGQSIDRSHALPSDLEQILRVETKWDQDPEDYWHPIVNFELEKGTTDQILNLYEGSLPGWDIRVVYVARFGALSTDFDTAGIPESYRDLIIYGVTSRMIRFLEPARLQLNSVENVSRANVVQAGSADRTATQLFALHQQRVAEERRLLLERFPLRPNFLAR
jgi:hypothetical protein